MPQDLIRVRKRHEGQAISGKVAFACPLGAFVNYDPADVATPSLKLASGVRAFSLQRQVIDDQGQGIPLQNLVFPNSIIINPELIGNHVTAAKLLEAEVEGPTLLPSGLANSVTAQTPAGTELTTYQGGIVIRQQGQELFGNLRGQLAPVDSGNPARILVQFIE